MIFFVFYNSGEAYAINDNLIREEFATHNPEFEITKQSVSKDMATFLETNEWPEAILKKYQIQDIHATKTEEDIYSIKVEYKTVLTKKTDEYEITVSCDANAGIPENATLSVNEISKKDEKYKKYLKETYKTLKDNEYASFAKMLDISILSSDGTEIEPQKDVDVNIVYHDPLSMQNEENIKIVHLIEEPEIIKPDVKMDENGNNQPLLTLSGVCGKRQVIIPQTQH